MALETFSASSPTKLSSLALDSPNRNFCIESECLPSSVMSVICVDLTIS